MDYSCNLCLKHSSDVNDLVSHLRKEHKVMENTERIPCLVNFNDKNFCKKSYLTFSGLKTHMKLCVTSKRKRDELMVRFLQNSNLKWIFNYYFRHIYLNKYRMKKKRVKILLAMRKEWFARLMLTFIQTAQITHSLKTFTLR